MAEKKSPTGGTLVRAARSTTGSGGVSRGRKTALGEELDAGGTSCLNYFKVALGSVVHSKHTQVFIKQKKKKKKPRRQGKKKEKVAEDTSMFSCSNFGQNFLLRHEFL
ncbi:hypothetical protein RUM43_012319 [Polyplax serrata]|uniref:Uncharacterized protein n=1 Tax=Polyplax serrata TaxID=468196 RepID=A0AAN8PDC4_POLSC